eukprot:CAMPEP_0195541100 /NCGR_PEP_ID=MMETSP0794_2-20130614/50909_1 /TAXON_ID=515487 /ORGANISM="Stephanopyxis turris, Strain CCMP 815" /LENGTH=458 /DNA_ID=CAMNT_0040675185 /DNA_START=165 /DNA_END=1541 /DNA_ORIENTATION=-
MAPTAKKSRGATKKSSAVSTKTKTTRAPAAASSSKKGIDQDERRKIAKDADKVLAKCRKLRDSMRADNNDSDFDDNSDASSSENSSSAAPSSSAIVKMGKKRRVEDLHDVEEKWKGVVEVVEMDTQRVVEGIEQVAIWVANSIMNLKGFQYEIPSRSASNQVYVPELDRIVLGNKKGTRTFLNVKEARKTAITTRVMQLLHQILQKKIHITKRDLFYTDVKLFVDQSESDGVLDDVATMIGCTRSNLHVVASDKGLVVGRINFVEDGDFIDCTKMGVGGKAIPPYIDKIENIKSDAEFILLVEKEAAYMRLAEDRFYHRYPCIIITAKGQPDVASRMFLSRIKTELQIPVLGLVDSDPYGLKILSVYMSGSKNMSYDSASLTTPDIKWLGLRPSDLKRYNLPEQCRLDMTPNDIKTGKELLKEDFIIKNPTWMKELEIMVKTKKKAEIQALSKRAKNY